MTKMYTWAIIVCLVLASCSDDIGYDENAEAHVSFSLYAPSYGITNYRVRLEKNFTNAGIPFFSVTETYLDGVPIQGGIIQARSFAVTDYDNTDYIVMGILPRFAGEAAISFTMLKINNKIVADYGIIFPLLSQIATNSCTITLTRTGEIGERVEGAFTCFFIDPDTKLTNIMLSNGSFSVLRQ